MRTTRSLVAVVAALAALALGVPPAHAVNYGPWQQTIICNPNGYAAENGGVNYYPYSPEIRIGEAKVTVKYWSERAGNPTVDGDIRLTNAGGGPVYPTGSSNWSYPITLVNGTSAGRRTGLSPGTAWGEAAGPIAIYLDGATWGAVSTRSGRDYAVAEAWDTRGMTSTDVNDWQTPGNVVVPPGKTGMVYVDSTGASPKARYYNGKTGAYTDYWQPVWTWHGTALGSSFATKIPHKNGPWVTVRYVAAVWIPGYIGDNLVYPTFFCQFRLQSW